MNCITSLLLFLSITLSGSLMAEGGGVGNGGDGIFCDFREPMTYDYYASGFLGTGPESRIDTIHDIYDLDMTVGEFVLEKVKSLADLPYNMRVNGMGGDDFKSLYKGLKRSLSHTGDYGKWTIVNTVPEISDTLQDDFIPRGCKILQVAKAIDGKVSVSKSLFTQLDKRQKEVLALHEALYYLGIKSYGHTSSYLTRAFIREILRNNKSFSMLAGIADVSKDFMQNILPIQASGILDGKPGSGRYNFVRLNIFDLKGNFNLIHEDPKKICPPMISIDVSTDRSFIISPYNIKSTDIMFASVIDSWFEAGSPYFEELSLDRYDRGFEVYLKSSTEEYNALGMGLNRQDQFLVKYFGKVGPACIYNRN